MALLGVLGQVFNDLGGRVLFFWGTLQLWGEVFIFGVVVYVFLFKDKKVHHVNARDGCTDCFLRPVVVLVSLGPKPLTIHRR